MHKSLSRNVINIYLYSFFYMFMVFIPVIVPLFQSRGLNMEEVFIAQAIFGIVMTLFEIPSGYIGDIFGRKTVLMFGSILYGLSFTFLMNASDKLDIYFFEAFVGIAASFVSGADLSVLYDSLPNDSRDEKMKAVSTYQAVRLGAETTSALVSGVLVLSGYMMILKVQMIVAWIPLVICFFLIEPPIERMNKSEHSENFKKVFRHIFLEDRLLRLIFINKFVWAAATYFAVWLIQKYWFENSISLSQMSYLWALCNFVGILSSKFSPSWQRKFGPHFTLILMCALPILAYVIMGSIGGYIGIFAAILFYIARGINVVLMYEAFNWRIPSEFRNTANSIMSQCFRLFTFVFGPAIGFAVDRLGLSSAFYIVGGVYFCIFFILMLPMLKQIPRKYE